MLLQKSSLCKYHIKYQPSYNKNDTEDGTEGEDKNDQLEVQYSFH